MLTSLTELMPKIFYKRSFTLRIVGEREALFQRKLNYIWFTIIYKKDGWLGSCNQGAKLS